MQVTGGDEQRRVDALLGYLAGTAPERGLDDITLLAARLCGTPMAAITLIGADAQWAKSTLGLDPRILEIPRSDAICSTTISREGLWVVTDALADPLLSGNPLVRGEPGLRFYAAAPLVTPEGLVLGALCVLDVRPRELSQEQVQSLTSLAGQVVTRLELQRRNIELAAVRQELQALRHFGDQMMENSPLGMAIYDEQGVCIAANTVLAEQLGMSREHLLGQSVHDIPTMRTHGIYARALETQRTGAPCTEPYFYCSSHGVEIWMVVHIARVDTLHGRYLVFRTEDITQAKRDEHERWALLHNLAQQVPGMIFQFRVYPDGRVRLPFVSDRIHDIFGVSPEEVRYDSSHLRQYIHPDDRPGYSASIERSFASLEPWHYEYRVTVPGRATIWVEGNSKPERLPDGSVLWHGYMTDITARKAAEARTRLMAYYDSLTGLANRELLLSEIDCAVLNTRCTGRFGALLFLDLDDFKRINDARGHSVGDLLLQRVGQRMTSLLTPGDMAARIGGDEFVVLAHDLAGSMAAATDAAMRIAERMRSVLEEVHEIEGSHYNVTGSIGVTLFPKDTGECTDDLLREADTAMYRAKQSGRNRISCFEPGMLSEAQERLALEQDLKHALSAGEFALHVQTQVDAAGREVGGELLLRWQHPRRGSVPPSRFVPLAEESGFICRIGAWVVEQACWALAQLAASGCDHSLSVNISPRQFHEASFVDSVRRALERSGAPASRLVLEVTESLFIDHWEAVAGRMRELHQIGVRFSIDDFGTGYSNLSYLRRLPLHEIKIDKSFVRDVPADSNDTAIVHAIIAVGRNLHLRVVAEGVETREQMEFLATTEVDRCQGFYYACPEPLPGWLERRTTQGEIEEQRFA